MSEEGHHEVLIIKRHGGGHEDGHHGGVWKIAFADFMTAMMAFFLVMWLISANDKTKATIAKYFNPIELVDSTPQPVGLNDSKKDDPNVERKSAGTEPPAKESTAAEEASHKVADKGDDKAAAAPPHPADVPPLDEAEQSAKHEVELIRDPYAVIAEIASKTNVDPPRQSTAPSGTQAAGGTGAVGIKGGDAFRDPFEPQAIAAAIPLNAVPSDLASPAPAAPAAAPGAAAPAHNAVAEAGTAGASGAPAAGAPPSAAPEGAKPAPPPPGEMAKPAAPPAAPAGDAAEGALDGKPLAPAALRSRITALVKASDPGLAGPKVEVRHTDEGTLISLTDSTDFSMFASASARPSPQAVALMAKVGRLLKSQKGGVTVRGFTDSRPFRSDTYDNWRLSSERAHIAQYMLVRGGLEDARIDRIEGYADRRPKNPKDPEAAENRRIEILLRNPVP